MILTGDILVESNKLFVRFILKINFVYTKNIIT